MDKIQDKKILLVEDEFSLRELYTIAFQNEELFIDTAQNGQEAIDKVESQHYDLILLDIMLPKLTGMAVLKTLKAPDSKNRNIPIIMLTNLRNDSIVREALKTGAIGYIIKANELPHEIVHIVKEFFVTGKVIVPNIAL